MDKHRLRCHINECINSLSFEQLKAEDEAIIKQILTSKHWQMAKSIFCYIPIDKEVNTYPLIENALANNKIVSVPYILQVGEMEAKQITDLSGLQPDRYGIPSPSCNNKSILPQSIDLIIVPGIAFEKNTLLRLGRGGGFYDRYLSKTEALRLAPTRKCQLVEDGSIAKDEYDLHVDVLVTANEEM